MRRLICVVLAFFVSGPTVAQLRSAGIDELEIPPGPPMPVIREMQCQSEVCLPGIYLACRPLELTDVPGPGRRVTGSLGRGERFRVVAARTVVLSAAVVRVTRDVDEIFGRPADFRQGEFLFLLDYRGEGWYSAWRNGDVIDVEQFWPASNFGPPGGFEYGGELIRQGETEVWYGIEVEAVGAAWVRSQPGSMLDSRGISMSGLSGRQDPIEACPE